MFWLKASATHSNIWISLTFQEYKLRATRPISFRTKSLSFIYQVLLVWKWIIIFKLKILIYTINTVFMFQTTIISIAILSLLSGLKLLINLRCLTNTDKMRRKKRQEDQILWEKSLWYLIHRHRYWMKLQILFTNTNKSTLIKCLKLW